MLRKRRADVAALFIFLLLSPKVLLIAQASRDGGRKKTSGIMEASDGRMGEEIRISANLQFKDAENDGEYEAGKVELRWDEAGKVVSLVESTASAPFWQSNVDGPPPSIILSQDPGGIYVVSLIAEHRHWKLRADRIGILRKNPFYGDTAFTGFIKRTYTQSTAVPKNITVASDGLLAGFEVPTGDAQEGDWARQLTKVLTMEVSLRWGLFDCLIAGTCVQSCGAPQCGGNPKHCDCLPRRFCHLDGNRCVPVTADDTLSPPPEVDEILQVHKFWRTLSVSNMIIPTAGGDRYLVRNESRILAAFEGAMEDVRGYVSKAEQGAVKAPEKLEDNFMYAAMLLYMVQNRKVTRYTLPWTHELLHNSAQEIESWVQKLQTKVRSQTVMAVKAECGMRGEGNADLSNLDDVMEHCGENPNASSAVQLARGGALIDGDQGKQTLALFPITGLVLVGIFSVIMGGLATKKGWVKLGGFFFVIGGACFIYFAAPILYPLLTKFAAASAGAKTIVAKEAQLASVYPQLQAMLMPAAGVAAGAIAFGQGAYQMISNRTDLREQINVFG